MMHISTRTICQLSQGLNAIWSTAEEDQEIIREAEAFGLLPKELILAVFARLTLPQLAGLRLVCKRWNRLEGHFASAMLPSLSKSRSQGSAELFATYGSIAPRPPRGQADDRPAACPDQRLLFQGARHCTRPKEGQRLLSQRS
jgi:hypothetical protein